MIHETGTVPRYTIYLGLKDKDRMQQLVSTEEFVALVANTCASKRLGFSLDTEKGGYLMENGTFVVEDSLALSFVGAEKEQILTLAEELRVRLNQETVLVAEESPSFFILGAK